ncbi:MAG: hypothetical protein H0V09_04705 [Gemmatimonadetes bacterium]|nr:hypothetical protein [Gemmatimonadota bacterium]
MKVGCAALLACFVPAAIPTAVWAQDGAEAERLYRSGRFEEAYAAYRSLAEEGGESPALAYDAGNALYRLERYGEAGRSYGGAAGTGPLQLRARALYNLGNARFKDAENGADAREALRGAVSAYEQALVLDPRDADAKWNLELALRRLEEQEQQQSGGGGGGGGGSDSRPADSPPPSPPQGPGASGPRGPRPAPPSDAPPAEGALTPEQARQLLEAIEGEEAETLRERDEPGAGGGVAGRDW